MEKIASTIRVMSLVIVAGLAAASAQATLLASDSFEYTGTTLDGQNGGTGWSTAWSSAGFTLSDDGVSLLYPDGSSDAGSRISEISASSASRFMTTGIDMNADATYYYSLLVNKTDAGSVDFRIYDDTSVFGRWRMRWNSSEAVSIGVTSSTGATVGTYAADQTLFLVTKLETVATGADTMSIKVFQPGDTVAEPTTWDATDSVEVIDLVLTKFGIYRNLEGAQVDAIRIGTTWEDVVPFAALHPGDANGDGIVNLADLQILGDNWQSTTASWSEADFTGDGNVNLADLQILGDNWGYGVASDMSFDEALANVIVPEPMSLAMLVSVSVPFVLRRRVRG